MAPKLVGKTTIYYGSGDVATDRSARMEAAARRRGYVDEKDAAELSPLLVYAFEFLDKLDPKIETEAERLGLAPWEYVNQMCSKGSKPKSQTPNKV